MVIIAILLQNETPLKTIGDKQGQLRMQFSRSSRKGQKSTGLLSNPKGDTLIQIS